MTSRTSTKQAPDIHTPESATLQNLLARERRMAVEQWTILNEMRLHGELPEWVKSNFPDAGTRAQAQERRDAELLANKHLLGLSVPCRYILGSDMNGEYYLRDGNNVEADFCGSAVDLALKSGVMEQLTARQLIDIACGLRNYADKLSHG